MPLTRVQVLRSARDVAWRLQHNSTPAPSGVELKGGGWYGKDQIRPCGMGRLELPVLVDTLDSPVKLLTQSLGEEALDRDVELLHEDNSQTRVDVVL